MPGQFMRRAEFYYQLAQLTAAGVTLPSALQMLERSPPTRSYRQPIHQLQALLSQGFGIADSFARVPGWLPEFDLALLGAGEQSGRIDACFRLLASYYEERGRLLRQLLSDLAYPVLLFHFAIFLLPFPAFFLSGDLFAYLKNTVGILIPAYLIIGLLIYASQGGHGEQWRARWEAIVNRVPVLGRGRHCLALARLSAALEALLAAGVTVVEAWSLAAAASGSPALVRIVHSWRPALEAGQTPADLVCASTFFPEVFAGQYSAGEISGKLDEHLKRLHGYYQEEGSRSLRAFAVWLPRLFYFAVVLLIAYKVLTFWSGYFQQIGNAAGF